MDKQVAMASMPKSETGMRTNKSGFTLIEILVVLVILGITTSMALFAFGDFGKSQRIEAEAERFAQKLRLIRYHAILEATPYRIKISPESYQIFRFMPPNQWIKSNIQTTSVHTLSQQKQPIIIQASGEITPFTLIFGIPGQPAIAQVSAQTNGVILFKKAGES
jgi:general secretion pathway protein H